MRRLLDCAPRIESLDLHDDGVRLIAGVEVLRRLAEEAAERLIALLDELDDDPDHEPGDNEDHDESNDEPSLGAAENHPHVAVYQDFWGQARSSDRGNQLDWASGGNDEREGDEHDGREPDEGGIADQDALHESSGEPSLGWTHTLDQTSRGWRGETPETGRFAWSVDDGEQGDDTGVGDAFGLDSDAEQQGDEEPGDNGVADEGGAEEVMGEVKVQIGFNLDRERRGLPDLPFRYNYLSMP